MEAKKRNYLTIRIINKITGEEEETICYMFESSDDLRDIMYREIDIFKKTVHEPYMYMELQTCIDGKHNYTKIERDEQWQHQ